MRMHYITISNLPWSCFINIFDHFRHILLAGSKRPQYLMFVEDILDGRKGLTVILVFLFLGKKLIVTDQTRKKEKV